MPKAQARHILVPTQAECESLKKQIEGGADFADLAKNDSSAPPAATAAALGSSALARWCPSSTRSYSRPSSTRSRARSRRSSATTWKSPSAPRCSPC